MNRERISELIAQAPAVMSAYELAGVIIAAMPDMIAPLVWEVE
jgi:hypothetical protein